MPLTPVDSVEYRCDCGAPHTRRLAGADSDETLGPVDLTKSRGVLEVRNWCAAPPLDRGLDEIAGAPAAVTPVQSLL